MPGARAPAAAGRFYPGEPAALARELEALLAAAPTAPASGAALGGVVPHAGYLYSGPAAARVYRALRGSGARTVAVVGTAHFAEASGLALDPAPAYATPLGRLPVDAEAAAALRREHPDALPDAAAHETEHSVEVQVPFLQTVLPDARVLPLITNVADPGKAESLGRALGRALRGRRALVLASSDLSHYPPAEWARRADPAALESCAPLEAGYVFRTAEALLELGAPGLRCAWCGAGAVAVALAALKELGAGGFSALAVANSADAGGDPDRTVGYGAALITRIEAAPEPWRARLEPEDRARLLALCRSGLAAAVAGEPEPPPRLHERWRLNLPCGLFVTWWSRPGPELRACLGTPLPLRTLGNAAAHFGYAGASQDARFPALRARELPALVGEISVLSPLRKAALAEIAPGLGVYLKLGDRSGLFLPEVWERLPERERFLDALVRQKAGLPEGAWRSPEAQWWVFTAETFRESGGG